MPLPFPVRRVWTVALAIALVAAGLAALGLNAIKAQRAEARERALLSHVTELDTSVQALNVLSNEYGRIITKQQSAASAGLVIEIRGDLDAASRTDPAAIRPLDQLFTSYEQGADVGNSPGSIGVRPGVDLVPLQRMADRLAVLRISTQDRLEDARTAERRALLTVLIAALAAFGILGGLLIPGLKAARIARRRATELALQRKAEERFQPIFEQHPQPMWVLDDETLRFLAVNDAMVERYGWTHEELMEMSIIDLHPPDDHVAVMGRVEREISCDSSGVIHCTKSGENLEVDIHARSMTFGGRAARMVLAIDVTERRMIARALAESEERHRTVIETAQEGIVVYDLHGSIQLMNDRMGEILGLDPVEQVGRPMADLAYQLQIGDSRSAPERKAETADHYELQITRPDKQERWVLASSSPWFGTDGAARGAVVMFADITERRENEERVSDSEALKTAMLDSSLDGIYTIDDQGRVLEFNRAAEAMFGVRREDALGKNALELLVPEEYRERADEAFWPLLRDERSSSISQRLNGWRADGTVFPAEFTLARMEGGRGAFATVHIRDITERDQYERTLKTRAIQQASVAELGAFSLQSGTIDEVYAEAAAAIARTLEVEYVHVGTLEGNEIIARAALGWKEMVPFSTDDERVARFCEILLQGPVIANADEASSAVKDQLDKVGVQSGLIVGVIVGGEMRGLLAAHSKDLDAFGSDEQYYMKTVSNVVGAALARHEAEERTRDLARLDALTGLPNRSLFEARLSAWGATATKPGAVAFVDVDHFKVLNDALGHEAGDQLLRGLAPRFAQALGENALVARFGGDEFVVLVEDVDDESTAKLLGERLLDTLTQPVEIENRPHHVSVSVGIKLVDPASDDLHSAVRDADSAMYQAKERGRDRVEVFDDALHQRVMDRLRVDRDLRLALKSDDELWIAYQPLISAETREVVGVEALARWHHPELGQLSPAEFIPAAEELGLIGALGWHVLERSVHDTAAWVKKGGAVADAANVSVNLSPQQLADPSLAPRIAVLLREAGLSPDRLTLEVTETTLMADTDAAQRGLQELAALGIRLVLDDFGTGFSSMAYLSRMPVSGIKIDRSFIMSLGEAASSEAIVKAIVSMADALELEVVAEGVETEEQARTATELGCGKLQGFLFSRPVPRADIAAVVDQLPSAGSLAA